MSSGTAAAPAAPTQDERSMAMLAHVLMIFTGFLGPLIIWLMRKESRFVSFHALQALAFQATLIAAMVLGVIANMVAFLVPGRAGAGAALLAVIFSVLMVVVALAGGFASIILGILYGIKANNGEWAAYPVIGSWVRQKMGA